MTRRVDITATDIAWCAQVERARRERWADAGRLKRDPPFTEHDAMETAIAFCLTRGGVSQKAATVAWEAIQRDVQRLLIAGERDIWVVASAQGPRAWAVADAQAAAQRADGQGRCWVVATGPVAAEARARYSELSSRVPPVDGRISHLSRSRRDVRHVR
jgi:hypothetical protein